MPIEFPCADCGKQLRVADEFAGQWSRCSSCGGRTVVPERRLEAPTDPGINSEPLQPPSDNPYASPLTSGSPRDIDLESGGFSARNALSAAWSIFSAHPFLLIAVHLIAWLLTQGFDFVGEQLAQDFRNATRGQLPGVTTFGALFLASMAFSVWLNTGRDLYFLEVIRGDAPPFMVLFAGARPIFVRRFLLVLLATIVGAILMFPALAAEEMVRRGPHRDIAVAVFALCGLAVFVRLLLVYGQAWYIVLDQPLNVRESLSKSREISEGRRTSLLLLGFVQLLAIVGGLCLLILGVFVTAPFVYLASIVAYLQLAGRTNLASAGEVFDSPGAAGEPLP